MARTNLVKDMEKLTKLVDEGHSVNVIYCDFTKSFDVVPQRRLFGKCRGLGIKGKVIKWVEEWLT